MADKSSMLNKLLYFVPLRPQLPWEKPGLPKIRGRLTYWDKRKLRRFL